MPLKFLTMQMEDQKCLTYSFAFKLQSFNFIKNESVILNTY